MSQCNVAIKILEDPKFPAKLKKWYITHRIEKAMKGICGHNEVFVSEHIAAYICRHPKLFADAYKAGKSKIEIAKYWYDKVHKACQL